MTIEHPTDGTPGTGTAAVVYAAKSSMDPRGSIETQLADGRALAEREGMAVAGEYSDEAASAYRGDRGPGLARAQAHAERERCALIVQHSDRLARGDGRRAKHLVEYALWAIKSGVTIRSVQDPQTFNDLLYAVVTGQRNHEDSARKSKATRDGLKRRAERGQPVGAVPIGYFVETTVIDGEVITRRAIDPTGRGVVERMFELAAQGATPGRVSRTLNAEGARTQRGKLWTTRAARRVLTNEDYLGATGYPALIDAARFEAVQQGLARLDAAAVQARKGGRPATDDFLLAGVGFCLVCGAPLRCRRYRTGTRAYRCSNALEGRSACASRPIRADIAEAQVLNHLRSFVGNIEDWLREQADAEATEQRARETAVERERQALADLDRQRECFLAEYRRQVVAGKSSRIALEEIERIDRERDAQRRTIEEAEAVTSEWAGPPDRDAALDLYNRLADLVAGRVRTAAGAQQLNTALRDVLAGIWFEWEADRRRLLAEFELRLPTDDVLPGGQPLAFRSRPSLPPARDAVIHPLRETGPQTFVYVHPQRRPISS